jgi:hypothetical protein
MNTKKLFLYIGIFLIIDAALSLYWGNFKINEFIGSFSTMSNSVLGNLVRLVRGGLGIILIYHNK